MYDKFIFLYDFLFKRVGRGRMKTLYSLIQQLEKKACPKTSLFEYQGVDWKHKIRYLHGSPCPYPRLLWKSDTMELVLYGWKEQQVMYYYTEYSAIYSHVLEGSLYHHVMNQYGTSEGKLSTQEMIPPLSVWNVRSRTPSASLFLFQTANQK
jgi:hypothetical protein